MSAPPVTGSHRIITAILIAFGYIILTIGIAALIEGGRPFGVSWGLSVATGLTALIGGIIWYYVARITKKL